MKLIRQLAAPLLLLGLASPVGMFAQAKPQDAKSAVTTIRVSVEVRNDKGAAVPGAGVVLKQVSVNQGKLGKDPFDVELHTDTKGQIVVQGFQPGIVLVQVIAHGYETWGTNFVLTHPEESVHVELKPPKAQVSVIH